MKVPYRTVLPKHAKPQNNENGSSFHVTWALGLFVSCPERHRPLRCVTSLFKLNSFEYVVQQKDIMPLLLERTLAAGISSTNPGVVVEEEQQLQLEEEEEEEESLVVGCRCCDGLGVCCCGVVIELLLLLLL